MSVDYKFRFAPPSPELDAHAAAVLHHLERLGVECTVEFTLTLERTESVVVAHLRGESLDFVARAVGENFSRAIDSAVAKLFKQVTKKRQRRLLRGTKVS